MVENEVAASLTPNETLPRQPVQEYLAIFTGFCCGYGLVGVSGVSVQRGMKFFAEKLSVLK